MAGLDRAELDRACVAMRREGTPFLDTVADLLQEIHLLRELYGMAALERLAHGQPRGGDVMADKKPRPVPSGKKELKRAVADGKKKTPLQKELEKKDPPKKALPGGAS